ncbi:Choline dehydrogenase, mitochondrial [Tolypocladium ophioglossoides CBS 100239]|uniref:Choline dehydrogenase, mitochondrial n=1 Tax=Tolypocladium ophioglossoides (strain CBS 100239) TaxID=1163406 RepID=A0A0L0NA79_TOLOC|nr:Choline dehydrogenase, mitochondrial [Tolypocladium ophioglossoides CBS 100239]
MVWKKPGGGYWVGRDPPEGPTQLGIWYPRAGTLGGCDTHNGGITVRPSDWDWDNIANTTSDASWKHEHMLGYFEKLDSSRNRRYFGYHKRSTSHDFDVVVSKDINKHSPDRDFQNDVYQVSFKKDEQGRRYSAGSRVNWAVSTGLPLTVRFDSLVTQVLIDDHLRATGVEYLEGEKHYKADPRSDVKGPLRNNTDVRRTATATREVIISGGTFNTPQILMLSGIGPKNELQQHGIRTRVDLPGVGKNLQDHYEVPVIQKFPRNFTFWSKCTPGSKVNPCYDEWKNNGTGPYTTVGFSEFVLYTSSVAPRGERDIIMYGYPDAILGHLPPYTNASDLTGPRLVDGVQFARKIFATIPGSDAISKEAYPGLDFASDDKLREYARAQSYGHHATGTASIGADDDPLAVLDANFKVRGVKGLRVVDASIFPAVPGTFPLIAIFMMSEKASDVILADATN